MLKFVRYCIDILLYSLYYKLRMRIRMRWVHKNDYYLWRKANAK